MQSGGAIEIKTTIAQDRAVISFSDTGSGMPPSVVEKIFEPFFTTKSQDKGTGLGLAICREIVNRYDGAINVQSIVGKGSTFIVTIPSKFLKNV